MDTNFTKEFNWIHWTTIVLLSMMIVSILAPPFLIMNGKKEWASFLYNLHSYDHQWIYRSQCVFWNDDGWWIEDCIPHGKEREAEIRTVFTKNGNPKFNGVFETYEPSQILERNKAEMVKRDGKVGWKFATDVRDYSIYIPMLMGLVFSRSITKKFPDPIWLVLSFVPLAIDGSTQLASMFFGKEMYWLYPLGLSESTNLIRMVTGAIAGFSSGVYLYWVLRKVKKEGREGKRPKAK